MAIFKRLAIVAAVAWMIGAAITPATQPTAEFDVRDAQGKVLIAAEQIRFYDWGSHTLTLVPGARAKLVDELRKGGRLVSGEPFTVCLGGTPVYDGNFTTFESSKSFTTPCILIPPNSLLPKGGEDQLHIQRCYPTNQSFKDDPRRDERLRKSLADSGKLAKAIEEHTAWVSGSLLEMQTIKQGMTREQLLTVFQEEGGISTRQWRRYAFRDCPYIKVNVTFDPVGAPDDKLVQDPRDIITQVSQPFLEWGIAD